MAPRSTLGATAHYNHIDELVSSVRAPSHLPASSNPEADLFDALSAGVQTGVYSQAFIESLRSLRGEVCATPQQFRVIVLLEAPTGASRVCEDARRQLMPYAQAPSNPYRSGARPASSSKALLLQQQRAASAPTPLPTSTATPTSTSIMTPILLLAAGLFAYKYLKGK